MALQVLLVLGPIAYALDLYREVGLSLFTEQMLAVVLGFALAIVFLDRAEVLAEKASSWRWLYIAGALLTVIAGCYVGVRYPTLSVIATLLPPEALIPAVILLFSVLEALRLAAGLGILIVVLAFAGYGLFGYLFPGEFQSRYASPQEVAVYLGIDANGMLGIAVQVAVVVVIPFVLFGQMLTKCGASEFFTGGANALMGRYRGGPAKVAITASALFGTISGSAVGNVVGTGVVTIPLMKRAGYPAHFAGAVEAVASTGGQLVPPVMGAVAFLMADFMGIAYGEVIKAALIPGMLYYFALFVHVDLLAAKSGMGPTAGGASNAAQAGAAPRASLWGGWHFALPFAVLFYVLLELHLRPEVAALWALGVLVAGSLLFGYDGRRPGWRDFVAAIVETGSAAKELIIVCAAAGIIIGVLNLSGLAFNLTLHIVSASGGSLALLAIITAAISIVLGMGMPTVGVYILLATLVVPALIALKVPPMAAHMFVLYFGLMSMITPPVALASFAAANIAGASAWKTSWASMRLGWTAYVVPFLFLVDPSLLLEGSLVTVVWAVVTAVLGVWVATAGIVGYLGGPLGRLQQLLLFVAGVNVLVPNGAYHGAIYGEVAGLAVAALFLLYRWFSRVPLPSAASVKTQV